MSLRLIFTFVIPHSSSTYHVYLLDDKKALKKTYWYKMSSTFNGPLVPQLEEDITKVEWLNKRQITEALKNSYPAIIEVCKAAGLVNETSPLAHLQRKRENISHP